jgi:hypothetical protein
MVFYKEASTVLLEKYANGWANVLDAHMWHFWTITKISALNQALSYLMH